MISSNMCFKFLVIIVGGPYIVLKPDWAFDDHEISLRGASQL